MIIAGLDAGFRLPGISVVDTFSTPPTLIFVDSHETERSDQGYVALDNVRRLESTAKWMIDIIHRFHVTEVAVELPNSGARSSSAARAMALTTGQIVGTLTALGKPTHYYLPHETKRYCTGNKDAEKDQMIEAVSSIWPSIPWPSLKRHKRPDPKKMEAISDSLAVLVTHLRLTGNHT